MDRHITYRVRSDTVFYVLNRPDLAPMFPASRSLTVKRTVANSAFGLNTFIINFPL
jgi:hypothetical protein